mmetsp:Transcript_24234/g.36078  ORF Transcript_24234/g.36078 Transcript_24234/m.36078 type:complete len:116 (+) Transcript_24234:739-1086(+)
MACLISMLSPASTNFDAMSTERSIINFTLVAGSNASTGANGATARAGSLFAGIINAAVDADIICWSTFLRFDDGGGAKAITSCVQQKNDVNNNMAAAATIANVRCSIIDTIACLM